MSGVRTTVTLDDELAAKLHATARERRVSFELALNEALRAGLATRRYRVPVRALEVQPGTDLDKASTLAGELEDAALLRRFERPPYPEIHATFRFSVR